MRGYFGIGIYQYHHSVNVGSLFRSALAFGANFMFTIGRKYVRQSSDTCNSPRHLPYFHYTSLQEFIYFRPKGSRIVCIETGEHRELKDFVHPEQAVYLLGNEVYGIPQDFLSRPDVLKVKIPSSICLNVSVAGSICIYDRVSKY